MLQKVFNNLKNVPGYEAAAREGAEEFARVLGLDAATTRRIRNAINVRSTADFKAGIRRCTEWLGGKVRGRPYALLVESGRTTKSSMWLGVLVVDAAGPPVAILTYDGQRIHGDPAGARCLVHLNDAIYSGAQMAGMIDRLAQREFDLYVTKKLTVYFAAAYGTSSAALRLRTAMNENAAALTKKSSVFFAKTLPETPLYDIFDEDVNVRPSISIMPHKVPNSVSFGAIHTNGNSLSAEIRKKILRKATFGVRHTEPYKQVRPNAAMTNLVHAVARASQRRNTMMAKRRKV